MNETDTPLRAARTGGTLIEVALGIVVLAVLAIGAAALYHQSWGQISIQRNKRAALVAANARLESIRASNYGVVKPLNLDYSTYFLSWDDTLGWVHAVSNPNETIAINGRALPVTTTVAYLDADGGMPSFDYLTVQVSVAYRVATPQDRVTLDTLISP